MAKDCCASVWRFPAHSTPCHRAGTVERDGDWYCYQHDPVAVKRRRAERDGKWKRQRTAQQMGWAVQAARGRLVDVCMDANEGDLPEAVQAARLNVSEATSKHKRALKDSQ